jgi:hypothetical protein
VAFYGLHIVPLKSLIDSDPHPWFFRWLTKEFINDYSNDPPLKEILSEALLEDPFFSGILYRFLQSD